MDQYFQKNLSAVAAQQMNFVPGGCRTPPGACSCCGCILPRDWGELPEAVMRECVKNVAAFPWLLHSSKSWGERFKSAVRPQVFLMCAYTNKCYLGGSFFPVLVALASQSCSLCSGKGRSNTSVL